MRIHRAVRQRRARVIHAGVEDRRDVVAHDEHSISADDVARRIADAHRVGAGIRFRHGSKRQRCIVRTGNIRAVLAPLITERGTAEGSHRQGHRGTFAHGLARRLNGERRSRAGQEEADVVDQQRRVAALGIALDEGDFHGGRRGDERFAYHRAIRIGPTHRR